MADEPLAGRALALLLESEGGLSAGYTESLEAARRAPVPDVVVWFGDELKAEAVSALAELRRESPGAGVCVVANGADAAALRDLLADDARRFAFVLRRERPDTAELVTALGQVLQGRASLHPGVLERVLSKATPAGGGLERLTRAEGEILELLAAGLRNREIARRLWKSEKAVEKHVGHIFAKLGLDAASSGHLDRRVTAARTYILATGIGPVERPRPERV